MLQNSWLIALAVGSGLMLIWPMLTKGGGTRVTVAQATLLINQKKAQLLDIRDDEMVKHSGAVPNAKRIEIKELKEKARTVAKNKELPILIMCQTGARSGAAATILKGEGYANVYVIEGGVNAWKEAGMPIRKQEQAAAPAGDKPAKASKAKA